MKQPHHLTKNFNRKLVVAATVFASLSNSVAFSRFLDFSGENSSNNGDFLSDSEISYLRSEKSPDGIREAEGVLADKAIDVVNSLGKSGKVKDSFSKNAAVVTERGNYILRSGFALNDDSRTSDPLAIQASFTKQASQQVMQDALAKSRFYKAFKDGFKFKIDFRSIFGTKTQTAGRPSHKSVRYGLVLVSIDPAVSLDHASAANGRSILGEADLMVPAKVKWTIGPITQNDPVAKAAPLVSEETTLLSEANSQHKITREEEISQDLEVLKPKDQVTTDANFWHRGLPNPAMKMNIKPVNEKAAQKFIAERKQLGLLVSLTQEDGLITTNMRTPQESGKKNEIEHILRLPVFGTLNISRRVDEKFKTQETSLNDILLNKDLPRLSVHFYEETQQYVGDGTYGDPKELELSFRAQSEAARVPEKERTKKENSRGYEFGIKHHF